jgi:hypothetical protein
MSRDFTELNKSRIGLPSWNKGKHWSKETKEKMRIAKLGKKLSSDHKKKVTENLMKYKQSFNKGHIPWNIGKKHSKETIEKIKLKKIGKNASMETRLKMSLSQKGKHKKRNPHQISWNKGKKMSREFRIKLSLAHGGNGNIDNKVGKRLRGSNDWKIWRTKVFERDNFTCNNCHLRSGELHPHHIITVKECLKMNKIDLIFDINNGITMCKKCHLKLHGLFKGDLNF